MKDGLIFENDELVYYKSGNPYHAGVIEVEGSIYYISSNGRAVKGQHVVHGVMTNGIIKKGTYTFGDDYKLMDNSYIAPKRRKKNKKSKSTHRNKNRLLRTLKKNVRKITPIALSLLGLVILVVLISYGGADDPTIDTKVPGQSTSNPTEVVSLPLFNEDVLLCSETAKQVYEHQMGIADALAYGTPYRPFVFKYQFNNVSGMLLLSENSDLTDSVEYALPADKFAVEIHNLKTGTTYYYQVRVNGEEFLGSFNTALSNRFISIPGTVNIRDIGGYRTIDGKIVKQGLLIRGTELDGLVNSEYFPSAESIHQMQETFGFVFDMDLRFSGIFQGAYSSRLGDGVSHKFYDSPQYGQIFSQSLAPTLRTIFLDLADPEKYPMYLHCTWGMDRTGTIVFLLQGILNVSEEDMVLEYMQTAYQHPGLVDSHNLDIIINGLSPYEGNTLQEKIVSFLTSAVGVTEEEIASIRSIFLEDLG